MQEARSASIVRFVYDDEYELCLNIGALIKLSKARECGPPIIMTRLGEGAWFVDDVRDTIRFALEGGGMPPAAAKKFAEKAVQSGYLSQYQVIAFEALYAAIVGVPEDLPEDNNDSGEQEAPTTEI